MNFRAIWEVWDYNKFNYGDRWASGFLFWYHNCPLPQVAGRLYDYYLEPTAALYYSQNGLSPLHPQFDYLKNTVSVCNDYRSEFKDYTVSAAVIDINSDTVMYLSSKINIPSDGVANDVIRINFPENISQVHFIKLLLKDTEGKIISDAFYWRSKDEYKGAWTLTGPAVSGFEEISKLPECELKNTESLYLDEEKVLIKVDIENPTKVLSFFTRIKLEDSYGNIIAPAFYSDNFFSLLPGENKNITIEIPEKKFTGNEIKITVDSFNSRPESKLISVKK